WPWRPGPPHRPWSGESWHRFRGVLPSPAWTAPDRPGTGDPCRSDQSPGSGYAATTVATRWSGFFALRRMSMFSISWPCSSPELAGNGAGLKTLPDEIAGAPTIDGKIVTPATFGVNHRTHFMIVVRYRSRDFEQ